MSKPVPVSGSRIVSGGAESKGLDASRGSHGERDAPRRQRMFG